MGSIMVKGLGVINIQGDTPSPEESQAILRAVEGSSEPAPIPEVASPQLTEPFPMNVEELTGGVVSRGLFQGGGAIGGAAGGGAIGTALGGPAGGLAGAAVGGAAGAFGGDLEFETVNDLLQSAGLLDPSRKSPSLKERNVSALEAAEEDFLFGAGLPILGTAFRSVKPLIGKMLGVRTPAVDDIVQAAKDAGLTIDGVAQVGAVDVVGGVRGKILQGSGKVLGIFPFIGGPFRSRAAGKADVVTKQINNALNRMAPTAVMADDLGINMVKAAREVRGEFTTTAARLYNTYRRLAKNLPADQQDILSATLVRKAARGMVQRRDSGRIILQDGEELTGEVAKEFEGFLTKVSKLPDRLSVQQLDNLTGELEDFVSGAAAAGFDVKRVAILKKTIERAFGKVLTNKLSKESGKQIVEAKTAADAFFSKGIVEFQTPAAQKFARTDKNIFKAGPNRVGALNEDEIARAAVNLNSPQAIRDLRTLVGPKAMGQAARKHFENSWDEALIFNQSNEIKGIDWKKFQSLVGLTGVKSSERTQVLREFLKSTDVSLDEVQALVKVASRIQVPAEVNTFIARRAALGGLGSAARSFTVGNMVKDNLIAPLGLAFLLRGGAKLIADPKKLAAMRRVLSPSVKVTQRRALLGRLIENIADEEDRQIVEPEGIEAGP